jgi:hypothetical protein
MNEHAVITRLADATIAAQIVELLSFMVRRIYDIALGVARLPSPGVSPECTGPRLYGS